MSSSLFITLIALGIIGGLAFFVSAGFRGSGKAIDIAPVEELDSVIIKTSRQMKRADEVAKHVRFRSNSNDDMDEFGFEEAHKEEVLPKTWE